MGNQVASGNARDKLEDRHPSAPPRRPGHKSAVDSASHPSRGTVTPSPDDFIGATPYPRSDERSVVPRRVDLRVFPSFRGLDDGSKDTQASVIYAKKTIVNVRVYRCSGSLGRSSRGGSASAENTLRPRYKILRRSRSSTVTGHAHPDQRSGTTGKVKDSVLRSESEHRLNVGSTTRIVTTTSESADRLATAKMDDSSVAGKVSCFESHFVAALVRQYRALPSYIAQTKMLSVAIHLRHGHQRHVTLHR